MLTIILSIIYIRSYFKIKKLEKDLDNHVTNLDTAHKL